LVVVARRQAELAELADELSQAGAEAFVLPTDLSVIEQIEEVIPETLERFGRVDVLVNNAGYGKQCRFEEMGTAEVERMFRVNVLAPMILARAACQPMRRQGRGSIINVASVGGVVAHPLNVAYCASKHALVGFSKSLRLELRGTGISVTAVCPAATRTEFFEVARGEIPFARFIDSTAVSPERVARVIVDASLQDRAVVFTTLLRRRQVATLAQCLRQCAVPRSGARLAAIGCEGAAASLVQAEGKAKRIVETIESLAAQMPRPLSEATLGDAIGIRDTTSRKPLTLSHRYLGRQAADGRGDLDHSHILPDIIGLCPRDQHHGPPPQWLGELGPPDLSAPHGSAFLVVRPRFGRSPGTGSGRFFGDAAVALHVVANCSIMLELCQPVVYRQLHRPAAGQLAAPPGPLEPLEDLVR
jgi:short-subunit dehydrogenase